MGYMSGSLPFTDFDGDGTRDGILRQLNVGEGLNGTLINGVLSLEVSGGDANVNDGTITLTAGTNISGGGDFTTNQLTAEAITFNGLSNADIQALITGTSPISVSASGVVSIDQSALSITESQISDLQTYLTAETNDLSSAVVWANVPNANITQGSVTQHQAALSITESQISDLQTYLTAETNDLSSAVVWANVPNANITQGSVTQHQAALSITESQISDLQTYSTATGVEDNADVTDLTNVQSALSGAGNLSTATATTTDRVLVQDADNSGDLRTTTTLQIANLYTETNDLSSAVVWANVPNANITQGSVTQHQAALSITESQISDLGTYQVQNAILTDLAGLTQASDKLLYFDSATTAATASLTAFGRSILDDANAAAGRVTLGVDAAGTDNSTDVTLATVTDNYLGIAGQVITAGTVPVALGGTGASTASAARAALGVDAAGTDNSTDVTLANTNYLSLSGQALTGGTVPIGSGGTGATTAGAARTALGVDAAGTDNSTAVTLAAVTGNYLSIAGQQITAGTVPVTLGGTGGVDAASARSGLGLIIGTDVQAHDDALDDISGLAVTNGNFIVGDGTNWVAESGATVRTSLGLGTAAESDTGDFATAAQGVKADTAHGWGNHASAGYLTAEADTLDDVVGRGSSTTSAIVIGGLTVDTNTLVVDTTNNRLGLGTNSPKTRLTIEGAITLKEQAAGDTDTAAYGQIWVKTGTPQELYFTNDQGVDIRLDSETDSVVGAINGLVKSDGGGTISAAVEDTDYQGVLSEGAFADGDKTKLDAIEASATADQDADEVPVAATPTNYTAATADVEAHLAGIDAELANKLGSASDLDISALTANTQIADADLLLIDDGANGTNRKITFDELGQWIRGEGVLVGRDGGVNKLRIRDSRDDGALTPDDWGNKQVSFDFTDQYDSLLPSAYWANVITLKGWTDSYRVAQLMTSATSEGTTQSTKDTEPLYFRSGEDSGWGVMREVLTFPIGTSGSTPNADGAANQILQTNGSGVLSWVDHLSVTEATVKSAIDGMTLSDIGTPASTDRILVQDASDSNNLKYADFSEFGGGGGGTPSGVAGAVQFSDGAAFASDDANLHWDDTNNRLGIGTNAPDGDLHVESAATGDIFVLECTDGGTNSGPDISMIRDSSSPADDDFLGRIVFKGRDDGGNLLEYGNIKAQLGDASNGSEGFNMFFQGVVAGTNRAMLNLRATDGLAGASQAEVCVNEHGIDMDFRVESDNKTSALFVRGSDGNVGIGTTAPAQELHVAGGIRQTDVTSAVLVANASGDLVAASNLSDVSYYQPQPLLPPGPGAPPGIGNWHAPLSATFAGWIDLGGYFVPAFQ